MAYANRGGAYARTLELDKAIADLDTAIRLDLNLQIAYVNRGAVLAMSGRMEDAIWHFHEAENLNPKFRTASLSAYGSGGQKLERHRLRELGQGGRAGAVERLGNADRGIEPPAILASPFMIFRASAEVLRAFPRDLRVELIIDTEGRVREPVVIGSLVNPAPVLVSLEVLRDWRFTPATLADQPVAVLFELDLPLTRGATERARVALLSPASKGEVR